eukprot:s17_g43.t1
MEDSACASLQCLAMSDARPLLGTEEALLRALEAQPSSQDVQIRALDLLSAFALRRGRTARTALLPAVPHCAEGPGLSGRSRAAKPRHQEPNRENPSPDAIVSRTFHDRRLARDSHDVCTRILAANGVPPAAEAAAPPLLTLQLLTHLALRRAARAPLRGCAALKRKALEALRLKELRKMWGFHH